MYLTFLCIFTYINFYFLYFSCLCLLMHVLKNSADFTTKYAFDIFYIYIV